MRSFFVCFKLYLRALRVAKLRPYFLRRQSVFFDSCGIYGGQSPFAPVLKYSFQ